MQVHAPTMTFMTFVTPSRALPSRVENSSRKTKKRPNTTNIPYWSSRDPLDVRGVVHGDADDPRAVERRDRDQVEDAEHDVDEVGEPDDLEGLAVEVGVLVDGERDEREREVHRRPGRGDERHPLPRAA